MCWARKTCHWCWPTNWPAVQSLPAPKSIRPPWSLSSIGGGNLVAVQRADNVGPHNTVAAQRKAFTSLSTNSKSGELGEKVRNDPASRNLNTVPELLLLGGGVPVMLDGDVIGAVGVAGAGGSANDQSCAEQAIAAALPNAE